MKTKFSLALLILSLFLLISFAVAEKEIGNLQETIDDTTVESRTSNKVLKLTAQRSSIAERRADEQIKWQVISGGGSVNSISGSYGLSGTVGQTATGGGTGGAYKISHGFWQDFASSETCCIVAGDSDDNGAFNISDAVHDVNRVFKGGPAAPCCDAADADNNGAFNISDAVYKINRVFKGGPPPVCGSAGNGPCP